MSRPVALAMFKNHPVGVGKESSYVEGRLGDALVALQTLFSASSENPELPEVLQSLPSVLVRPTGAQS